MNANADSEANAMEEPPDSYPEDVQETFEFCDDCRKVVVSVDQHTCTEDGAGSGNSRKSAAQRARLAALDDRPEGADVLFPTGRSGNNAWAYHELDADGEALHDVNYAGGDEIGTRGEAINKGCYPCGTCRLIQERRDDAGGSEADAK